MQVVCTLTALTDLSLKSNELTALTPLVGNLVELRTLDVRLLLVSIVIIFFYIETQHKSRIMINLDHLQTI